MGRMVEVYEGTWVDADEVSVVGRVNQSDGRRAQLWIRMRCGGTEYVPVAEGDDVADAVRRAAEAVNRMRDA